MTGFAEKLRTQSRKTRGEGLVWVGDSQLAGYFRQRHPHVRHVRHAGERRTDAWACGLEAGREIILHRAVEEAPTLRGRLLKP